MAIKIYFGGITNLGLSPCKVPITRRIFFDILLWYMEYPFWIDRNEFVFVEQQCLKADSPTVLTFLKQKKEPTVCLVIHLNPVRSRTTSDSDFHLTDCTFQPRVDIYRRANDAM